MFSRLRWKKLSSFQIIIAGFLAVILIGAVLLMLPASAEDGQRTSWEEALFTATSAVCVTGLVVRDTATYWSGFGQSVILILIQIGGLGIVTVTAFIAVLSGKRLSLRERSMLQESLSAHQVGGVVRRAAFLFLVAFIAELTGALLLLPAFCGRYGRSGVWMAVFHSVSAFCNAGFDLMGDKTGAFSSLTAFRGTVGIVLPVCLLIVTGGLGFLTWEDIAAHRFHFKRYRVQTKIILTTTGVLILLPAAAFFCLDFSGLPLKERIWCSVFHAVTPRTAGFNTVDPGSMTSASQAATVILMLIGGSPGSTAGGMKTTTAAVLFANAMAVFRRKKSPEMFGRRIEESAVRTAATLMLMYVLLSAAGAFFISVAEGLPMGTCLYETASAIGTVGLSLGITPGLGLMSRLILIVLMFFGRVGGLTLMFAALGHAGVEPAQLPMEKVHVG